MASSSPLDDFLDRTGKVFSLAGDLGRALDQEHERQRQLRQVDPTSWDRHSPIFQKFGEAVLLCREAMENPPVGFERVAEQLLKATRIAEEIWNTMQQPHGRYDATYLDFFPRLISVFNEGWDAVKEATKVQGSANPFSGIEKRTAVNQSDIDTTPTLPEPPAQFVQAAERNIPGILANIEPRSDGAIEMVASHLAKQVQDAGHTLAAAHWAVHEAVRAGRLMPGRIEVELPSFGRTVGGAMRHWGAPNTQRMEWSGGQKGTMAIPEGKPAPFDNFKVKATDSLWVWWRSNASEPRGQQGQTPGADPSLAKFHSALDEAQETEKRSQESVGEEQRERQRRQSVFDAWERIYQTRPRRRPGEPENSRPPEDWRQFAEAVIEFCKVAREMGFEAQLRRTQGRDPSEVIAIGLVVSGFDKDTLSLAELISQAPVGAGWCAWFNRDLSVRWIEDRNSDDNQRACGTAETNSKQQAAAMPDDLLTIEEIARLAMVQRGTLHTTLSEARKSADPTNRPPAAAIKGGGRQQSRYSYKAIRPWLLRTFPAKDMRFLESFEEVKRILATA